MPGVQQVSLSGGVPPGAAHSISARCDRRRRRAAVRRRRPCYRVTGPFFDLFGIRCSPAGRSRPSAPDEVILGEHFARRLLSRRRPSAVRSRSRDAPPFRSSASCREIRSPSLDPLLDEPEMYLAAVRRAGGRVEAPLRLRPDLRGAALRHVVPGCDAISAPSAS
jgi:hypothetical protein